MVPKLPAVSDSAKSSPIYLWYILARTFHESCLLWKPRAPRSQSLVFRPSISGVIMVLAKSWSICYIVKRWFLPLLSSFCVNRWQGDGTRAHQSVKLASRPVAFPNEFYALGFFWQRRSDKSWQENRSLEIGESDLSCMSSEDSWWFSKITQHQSMVQQGSSLKLNEAQAVSVTGKCDQWILQEICSPSLLSSSSRQWLILPILRLTRL